MEQILLKTENLSKSFSSGGVLQHVLKNIDLELYQGDFTVIMGASGDALVCLRRVERESPRFSMLFPGWIRLRWERLPSGTK